MFDETIWEGAIRLTDTFTSVHGDSNKGLKILDLGCGTGIIGSLLAKHGYTNIEGLDLSEKMMEKAEEKKVYNKFICAVVTAKRLDIPTGDYDALIGAGAITSGYIKPDAMDEVVRLVKPGKMLLVTVF
jgi:ubiquinone/menaquinone biosynthesis C-methylase UbiE